MAMPLVDLAATRARLLRFGWIREARVSRRLPDTLVIDIVERQPVAIWQNNQQLSLIDADGVVLEPVRIDHMPNLPLVIGPDANRHIGGLGSLLQAAPRLRPQIAGATWVGQRRWDIRFQSGELLTLPEGDEEARRAITPLRDDGPAGPVARPRLRPHRHARSQAHLCPHLARARRDRAPTAATATPRSRPAAARPVEDDLMGAPHRPDSGPQDLVAALDVGSSKVCALIAEPDEDGKLRILGTGQRESRGVKRGFIADMEKSEIAIREAVEQAERIAGTQIDQVFVGFSAGGLVSNVAGVEVAIGGRRITDRGYRRFARRGPGVDRSRRAAPSSTPSRRSTRSTGSTGSSSRAASMPTRSRSTSTSSAPIRRR